MLHGVALTGARQTAANHRHFQNLKFKPNEFLGNVISILPENFVNINFFGYLILI